MKSCKTCGMEKPLDEFYKCSRGRLGRQTYCKLCVCRKSRDRQKANPTLFAAYSRKCRAKDPEKHRASVRKHRAKDPEATRERDRKYQAANRDILNARARAKRKADPEKARDMLLRQRFGIGIQEYQALLTKQSGVCAICGKPDQCNRRLAVDHDHQTGNVRGLLCGRCNTSLGGFQDSLDILKRAMAYLSVSKNFPTVVGEVK